MRNFLGILIPEIQAWETLQEEQRILTITVLARLIVQTTVDQPPRSEEDHDR